MGNDLLETDPEEGEVVEELISWHECQEADEWWEECEQHEEHDRIEDGGGMSSTADWSGGSPSKDCLAGLRDRWYQRLQEWDLVRRLQQGFTKGGRGLLSEEEIRTVRADAVEFLRQRNIDATDAVSPGQPFALDIIEGLLRLCGDGDQSLPGLLAEGIRTGIWDDINPSGVFPAEDRANRSHMARMDGHPVLL